MTRVFDRETDDGYVELPPERRTLPKVALVLIVLVGALGFVGLGARTWYQRQVDPPGPPGDGVDVEVAEGTTVNGLGSVLDGEGVISNATMFRFWVRDRDVSVQAGVYRFRKDSSFEEALAVVSKGPAPPPITRLTVPEGLTLRQITERLAEADARFPADQVQAALADPATRSRFQPIDQASLEGLLFPSTYDVAEEETAASIVKRMVTQMDVIVSQSGVEAGVQGGADAVPELNPYEILIVASLIQAETGNDAESPQIARVIYNRLAEGTPLGIDATSRYLAQLTGEEIDLESDSPYNTRLQAGLPPTPIAAPGEAAIQAALRPADGPWLYYVLEAEGQHFFTASYDEFLAKKAECEAKGLGCG